MKKIILGFIILTLLGFSQSLDKKNFIIKIYGGVGSDETNSYGLNLLLPSGEDRYFGLEISRIKDEDDSFNSIGIVLEQKIFNILMVSIGTIGYFGYKNEGNVIGLSSTIRWELDHFQIFTPFIGLKQDYIFAEDTTDKLYQIIFGLKISF